MKYFFCFCSIVSALTTFSQARQSHFVYFQTENKQPFYVKVNKDILSSTSLGYLIVPKLNDSIYQFSIGFPAREWPEQTILLSVNKDAGFLLKNFDDKGWGLFNLQTFQIVMNHNDTVSKQVIASSNTDQFSTLLSTVVNDSSIRQTVRSTIPDTVNRVNTVIQTPSGREVEITDSLNLVKTLPVKKLSELSDKESIQIIYIDESEGTDTITTILDFFKEPKKEGYQSVTSAAKPPTNVVVKDTMALADDLQAGNNEVQQNISLMNPSVSSAKKDTAHHIDFLIVKTPMVNSNCTENASGVDLEKLERKMVSESSDDDKIKVARKIFKTKCFTTQYVRQLSRLFITSAGKYNFYDMAYPYVSDSGLYHTLEGELLDPYYIKRFQALINK